MITKVFISPQAQQAKERVKVGPRAFLRSERATGLPYIQEGDAKEEVQTRETMRETVPGKDNLSKRAGPPTQKRMEKISIIPIGRRNFIETNLFNKGRKFPRNPGDREMEVNSATKITDHSSYFTLVTGKMRTFLHILKTIAKDKTKRGHKRDTLTREKETEENDSTDEEGSLTLKSNDIKSLMRILQTVMMNTAIIREKLEASTNKDSTMEKLNAKSATQLEGNKFLFKKIQPSANGNPGIRGAIKAHTISTHVTPTIMEKNKKNGCAVSVATQTECAPTSGVIIPKRKEISKFEGRRTGAPKKARGGG
jgi:hypothetical protein